MKSGTQAFRPIRKLLVANRGEIAVRIARACIDLGITSAAVYSEADRGALHVRACDEAYYIGPAPAAESYLRGDRIIEVARRIGCDAVHPGYGFLSENASFAQAVEDAGLTWVGPSPEAISLMGSKIASKRLAEESGVPVVPGYWGDDQSADHLSHEAKHIGYPVLIKASAGGGGKGMRVVTDPAHFPEALEGARREAASAFGDPAVMLERYLTHPRHIEVQVLGDRHGNLLHLGERECSIQRRHQKVLEESPSTAITDELRAAITGSALALARAAGYYNAGTVEFIYQEGEFYFLEMNTRLQVEHRVTEQALGFDLVKAQIRIASGAPLEVSQDQITFHGHSVEVRLYAENPDQGFLPSTGKVTRLEYGDAVALIDPGISEGDIITPYYDPMIAKIVASGNTRYEAIERLSESLGGMLVEGVTTNLDFLRWLVNNPAFQAGETTTRFIEENYLPGGRALVPPEVALAGAALRLVKPRLVAHGPPANTWQYHPWRQLRQEMAVALEIEGVRYDVALSEMPGQSGRWLASVAATGKTLYAGEARFVFPQSGRATPLVDELGQAVHLDLPGLESSPSLRYFGSPTGDFYVELAGRNYWVRLAAPLSTESLSTSIHLKDEDTLESPMPGKILKVFAEPGTQVTEDEPLVIVEAMKMEFTVRAPHDGRVAVVHYKPGDQVAAGDVLVELEK